jgi:hypothetical protein
MTDQELIIQQQMRVINGVQESVAKAIDRHRRLGESIAIMQNDQIVILTGDEIPAYQEQQIRQKQTF